MNDWLNQVAGKVGYAGYSSTPDSMRRNMDSLYKQGYTAAEAARWLVLWLSGR